MAQDARGLKAQASVQVAARRTGPMEIGGLRGRDCKSLVVAREPNLQELIGGLDGREACQAQVFHQAILQRLEQPQAPLKLTVRPTIP